jgi:hypothetical protein
MRIKYPNSHLIGKIINHKDAYIKSIIFGDVTPCSLLSCGVTSQKMIFFIAIAVKTSIPTGFYQIRVVLKCFGSSRIIAYVVTG